MNGGVVALRISELGQRVANRLKSRHGLPIGRYALKVDVRFEPAQRFGVRREAHALARATGARRLSHFVARCFVQAHRGRRDDALHHVTSAGNVVHGL